MGYAIDTLETFEYVLTNDRDKPEEVKPTFLFRFLSSRDFRKMGSLIDTANKSYSATNDFDKWIGELYKAVQIPLAGWRNIKVEFVPTDLDAVCSDSDIIELMQEIPALMVATELDKKKRKSQLPETGGKSVSSTETKALAGTAVATAS